MKKFSTINDVINSVNEILGDYAGDFDVEGIAREVSERKDGRLVAHLDRDDFWTIAQRHDNTAHYIYVGHVDRMLLHEEGQRYVELNLDAQTGESYQEDWFDTEAEAIAYVKDEIATYDDYALDGKGYVVNRTKSGLDSIDYIDGSVDRYYVIDAAGEGFEVLDYGNDPKTSHFYEGYFESSLPEDVRSKAMAVQVGYHRFLDYESEGYSSLAGELENWED